MACPATGGCQGVAQPECRGPRRNSAKRSYLPRISKNVCLQLRKMYQDENIYLVRIPCTVLPGISEIRPMVAAFTPATEVLTTGHR